MGNSPRTLDSWPPPRGSHDCPTESMLAEWIRDPENEQARAHLSTCAACKEAVEHARKTACEAEGNLQSFMLNVRSRAQSEAEQHSSWHKVFINYISASRAQTVGAVAAVLTLVLIATSGLWRQIGFLKSESQGHTIVMDRDINGECYRQAVIELRDSYSDVSSGKISKGDTLTQLDQLNEILDKVDKDRLQPAQKAQLEGLQAQYQAVLFRRFWPNSGTSSTGTQKQSLESDFFTRYASYLAKNGEQLTMSPEVKLKFSTSTMYVIGDRDTPEVQKDAVTRAIRDLQRHTSDRALVYKIDDQASHPD